jgi:hypothetical protein
VLQEVCKLALRQEELTACLSHICRVDFMDKTVKKICEKHGLDKKIVEEIINCSSVKDEKKRLKKISSLLERL